MATFLRLEKCLLPPPEIARWNGGDVQMERCTTTQKVVHYAKNLLSFVGLLALSPVTLAYDWATHRRVTSLRRVPDIAPQIAWPPAQRGFACSLFQTSGFGTRWSAPVLAGRSDWDRWMDTPSHVIRPHGFDNRNFYTDVLTNPTPYIAMLQAHNVTAHRLSLEWSVIEPRRGEIDEGAVTLYRTFIRMLIEAGITPSVTLNHFVVPAWFYQQGNFQRMDNIQHFLTFARRAIESFPEVNDWWSFNELGIKAFQQAREVFPTDLREGSSLSKRVHAAGIATRNMLIAHCQLHAEVARLYPGKRLGVTHQWLKFDMATGNWLEQLVRYFFEKFAFYPVYGFFKNGSFSFEFPFMANIRFEMSRTEFQNNGRFLMCLGVQAYPKPMVKMGLNYGERYPCTPGSFQNAWFTFGSACERGGTLMRFGPRHRAEGMDEVLDEAFALTDQVCITEYGADAAVHRWGRPGFAFDEESQGGYLRQLTERIRAYCVRYGKQIHGIFCWSDVSSQQEWDLGREARLGLIHPTIDQNRQMTGFRTTSAARYLAEVYRQPVAADQIA